MSIAISLTPGETWPDGTKVTLARLRKSSKPSVALSGTFGTDDMADNSVTAAKVKNEAFAYTGESNPTDAIALSITPAPAALVDGLMVRFNALSDKTSAATFDLNGLGAKPIRKHGGVALDAGDIRDGQMVELVYNSTLESGVWEMTSQLGQAPNKYAADAGSTDAYAITLSPAPTALYTGLVVRFKANTANTGACTLNVNALGAVALKKFGTIDPQDGDILSGQIVECFYDGTAWQILSQVVHGNPLYAADGGGSDTYAITLSPILFAYFTGLVVRFKANTANTGAASLNVNGLGAVAIKKFGTVELADNDIQAGQVVELIHDGTNFQLLSAPRSAVFVSGDITIPTAGTAITPVAHGLGGVPSQVLWVLKCTNVAGADGYTFGDELPTWTLHTTNYMPTLHAWSSATQVGLGRSSSEASLNLITKGTLLVTNINGTTDWVLKCYARR